jgi:hypothetical protein
MEKSIKVSILYIRIDRCDVLVTTMTTAKFQQLKTAEWCLQQ